jgi:hypothetical protein
MRSKGKEGLFARALPHNQPVKKNTPLCACGLPLDGPDCPKDESGPKRDTPCEALERQESAADREHLADIKKELPPCPGERKKNSSESRETPQPGSYLNIGELHRWVLLRGENEENKDEVLQHDILWHFSPHKICWSKNGSQSNTPRNTPSNTPRARGGRRASSSCSTTSTIVAQLSVQLSDAAADGGAAAGSAASARKRSVSPSVESPEQTRSASTPITISRKKLALETPTETPISDDERDDLLAQTGRLLLDAALFRTETPIYDDEDEDPPTQADASLFLN